MTKEDQKINQLLKAFSQRPIAYQKIYSQITGSVTAGLLLSQIVYWWYVVEQREFYKTDNEFIDELALGPRELKNAKDKLKKMGIISTTRKGVPCRTFYKLDESALLAQISSWAERAKLVWPKGPNWSGRKGQTITKTNPRDYTETTKQQKISSEDILVLDLKINEAKKKFMQSIGELLRPAGKEQTTFARITMHLVDLCQTNRAKPSIFEDAISWAKEAKRNGKRPKAMFVAKIKQETGFKAQSQILRNTKKTLATVS